MFTVPCTPDSLYKFQCVNIYRFCTRLDSLLLSLLLSLSFYYNSIKITIFVLHRK